jgi:hypothetical protein
MDWILHLLATYTLYSELQAITAPKLTFTLYKSLLQTLSLLQPLRSNGFCQRKFFGFPRAGPLVTAAIAELSSSVNSS